jgi:hypothetical protein
MSKTDDAITNEQPANAGCDEYDCPCRLASALSDAMEAISDMIMKGQCVHSTEVSQREADV